MSLRKTFHTDAVAEVEGVTVPVAINEYNGKEITIRLSRMGSRNKRYTKELNRVTKPHESAIQNGAMDNDLARGMLQEVFADTILLGWDNLPTSDLTGHDTDWAAEQEGRVADSDPLPFTRENALALFAAMPDLYDDWEQRAQKAAAFREAGREASRGN